MAAGNNQPSQPAVNADTTVHRQEHRFKGHIRWFAVALLVPTICGVINTAFGNLLTEPLRNLLPVNRALKHVNDTLMLAQRADDTQNPSSAVQAYKRCLSIACETSKEFPQEARPLEVEGICLSYLAAAEPGGDSGKGLLSQAAMTLKSAERLCSPQPLSAPSQLLLASSLDRIGDTPGALARFKAALRQIRQKPDHEVTPVEREFMLRASARIEQLEQTKQRRRP